MDTMTVTVFLNKEWNAETDTYDEKTETFEGVTGISASDGILGVEVRTATTVQATVFTLDSVEKWEIFQDISGLEDEVPADVEG
jgi:hypothetical protein